ncbi:hypothetical protein N1031_03305 [Herbiconiux moechotypicola]|uniref:Glycosyltransferase RgtA/B/C/D-like domain-containing protein n=1 Tax=Herbiconiux moechotypicola TaxID=637393 RepID=A0ABN3DCM0_9MICO|nr:hypothetical protein [Herbiconiux moechotypicola]MCS5728776.1 hypothetical protein [Herbiconiux moechotypicola]
MTAAISLACALIAYARIPAVARGVVWAEDGRFFLEQRYDLGMLGSLFHVYQGYLQFVPRLVTDAATAIAPLSDYGLTVTRLICLLTGAIAGLVFLLSRDVVSSLWARATLALITVLAPMLPFEVLGNSANIHWLCLWLAPWLLLFRPSRWWQSAILAALMMATVLTEIQALLFLPLVAFQIRHKKTWPVGAALLVGGAAQVIGTLISPRDPSSGPPMTALNALLGYVQNVLVGGMTGSAADTGQLLTTYGWAIGLVFALPFVLAAGLIAARSRWPDYPGFLALLAGATVTWVASAVANAGPRLLYSEQTQEQLASVFILRYGLVPSMFLLALVVLAADKLLAFRSIAVRVLGAVVLVACVAVQLLNFTAPVTRRDDGPAWGTGYAAALESCRAGASEATIPTAPEGWDAVLPCDLILGRTATPAAVAEASGPGSPSSPTPAGGDLWPDGASPDTPRCTDASAATVAAVNATITTPQPGEAASVGSLRAHPDPDAAVWILTGHLSTDFGATVEVAWATTADPTTPSFTGTLRSVGEAAATISTAPAISLVVNNPDGSGIPEDSCH